MPRKPKKASSETALVQVLEPTAGEAYSEAKSAMEAIPPMRLPEKFRKTEHFDVANSFMRQIATARKVTESKRKSVTKHLDAAKKAINLLFKPLTDHLDSEREALEEKLDEYEEWQMEEAEKEREKLRKQADAKLKRAKAAAAKKLEKADGRAERKQIKSKLQSVVDVTVATLDSRLDSVDDMPDVAEGVSRIEDVEVTIVRPEDVPETYNQVDGVGHLVLWERDFNIQALKTLGKAEVEVPGVEFELKVRRAVKSL